MKRFAIFTILAATASAAAHADVEVQTPKTPVSPEAAAAYVAALDRAIRIECAKAAAPLIGPNFYRYQACLKATREDIEKKDPTGLYASREMGPAILAAR